MWGSRAPDGLPSPAGPCCYLGLGVDEQNPVSVDGDEDDGWVGGLRGLLGRGMVVRAQLGKPGGHLPEAHACIRAHMPVSYVASALPQDVCLKEKLRLLGPRAGWGLLGQAQLAMGETYLHLEEGRTKGGPPADPL